MMKIIKNIFSRNFWSVIKDLNCSFFRSISFPLSLVALLIMQFVFYKGWLNFNVKNLAKLDYLTAIIILIFLIWLLVKSHILQFIKVKEVTPFDLLIYGSFLTLLSSITIIKSVEVRRFTKLPFPTTLLYLCVGLFGLLIIRLYVITSLRSNINEEKNPNEQLYELKDLAQGKIFRQKKGPILVNERAADYDLLNRGNVVRLLLNAIPYYSSSHSYVIGLVGDWGSGKTTIVNLVKKEFKNEKNKDIKFMHAPDTEDKDFDLWLYGSKQSMIKGLYDTFLSNMDVNYNSMLNDKFINNVSQVVAGVPKVGGIISTLLPFNTGSYRDVFALREKLSKYIKSTRKHYVLCVENLDRANNQQIILLLKLINSVFDLPNVTYVLLYSERRLNDILQGTDSVNTTYADKVINLEIKIPTYSDKSNCKIWLQNLLLSYNVNQEDLSNFDYVLSSIVSNLHDIRELKRIINSVFPIMTIRNTIRLNLPQVIAIQYIYFSNRNLYEEIKSHEDNFLFEDKYGVIKSTSEVNEADKKYFKDFKTKYDKYSDLIDKLFPKFKLFNNGISRPDFDINEALKTESICTRAYFNDYFDLVESDHVKVNNQVKAFVEYIRNNSSIDKAWNDFIINNKQHIKQSQLISELVRFIPEVTSPNVCSELVKAIFMSMKVQANKKAWEGINEYDIVAILGTLIEKISEDDFSDLESLLSNRYEILNIISLLKDYMDEKYKSSEKTKKIKHLYDNMCQKIYDKRVNLYNKRYYNTENIYYLSKYLAHDDRRSFNIYLKTVVSSNNIYRILYDEIATVGGISKTGYHFVNINTSIEPMVNDLLSENPPQNRSQTIVFKACKNYLSKKDNIEYYQDPIDPDLL